MATYLISKNMSVLPTDVPECMDFNYFFLLPDLVQYSFVYFLYLGLRVGRRLVRGVHILDCLPALWSRSLIAIGFMDFLFCYMILSQGVLS